MSLSRTVRTQAELDAALALDGITEISIRSDRAVRLELLGTPDDCRVSAFGSATVRAFGPARVSAFDSATVHAFSSVTVSAFNSATVHAYDSATVHAFGWATVRAGKFVAVHLHASRATVTGGVVIDVTDIDRADAAEWCDINGVDVIDGHAIVYKAVHPDLRSDWEFTYPIGETVTALDWRKTDECGYGLHFGPTPNHAKAYYGGRFGTARFLACRILLAHAIGITGGRTVKIKARSCEVLYEVDAMGRQIT